MSPSERRIVAGAFALVLMVAFAAGASAASFGYSTGDREGRMAWVLIRPGDDDVSGSGEAGDYEEARALVDEVGQDFLWARLGDHQYVIADPAMVRQARRAMEPVATLGREQGKLGRMQAEIGRAQSQVGRAQSRIGQQQSRFGVRQARLAQEQARRARLDEPADDLERESDSIQREMDRLAAEQDQLSAQQNELARRQEPLARRQQVLGERQAALSKQLSRQMETLVLDAVRRGIAKTVD